MAAAGHPPSSLLNTLQGLVGGSPSRQISEFSASGMTMRPGPAVCHKVPYVAPHGVEELQVV
uniref:Uncharacterized protein n=1 Tax=Oryza punctata TaxID=4537 RepID=A0A0E0JF51_ORYPU